jgi:hypothetical protein
MKTLNRQDLIKLYYETSPRELEDLIDLEYEKNRINTMPLEELRKEIEVYKELHSWL